MRGLVSSILVLFLGALVLPGCPDSKPATEEKPVAEAPEKEVTPEMKEALGGAPTASAATSGKSDPLCVGPVDLAPLENRKVGAFDAKIEGYKVTFTAAEGDDQLVVGVIGDVKEDTGENLFNVERLVKWFQEQKVEAVMMTGDTAETEAGIVRVLERLAAPGWPVFAIVGNREAKTIFADGVTAAQAKHPNIFSLNKRRQVSFPEATFFSVPGYHDARFIHAEDGCLYHTEDLAAIEKLASETEGNRVLVSHGPPRGTTKTAIDVATDAGNVGDANLNGLIEKGKIAFGLFGNIHEAGGQATNLAGAEKIAEKSFVKSLYLNVGPADAIRWMMNDGSESTGMAGVVTFKKDGTAAYQMKRLAPLTEAEAAEAAKLDPAPEEEAPAEEGAAEEAAE
ncbi:MAG: hypothetical protein P1V51_10240 [Deltaproteobacteria bacterium]|nr:hypothetical protein [Deltaproteobacteria bacterium]